MASFLVAEMVAAGAILPGGLLHTRANAQAIGLGNGQAEFKAAVSVNSIDFGISTSTLPAASVGSPYSVTLEVYGGVLPYTYDVQGLAQGLTADPLTGAITGTPAIGSEGDYTVDITVKDRTQPVAAEAKVSLILKVGEQAPSQPKPTPARDLLNISQIASYSVGTPNKDGGVAEIVKFNRDNGKFYLVNGSSNPPSIEVVPLSGQGTLVKERTIAIKSLVETQESGFQYGDLTSIDINTTTKTIAAAVQEADHAKNGLILVMDYDGNLLRTYEAGVQPDMVKYTSDGRYILTADEGEPREAGIDPEGSVTIVDTESHEVTHVKFDQPGVIDDQVHIRGEADGQGKITGKGTKADALHDLEPEYIALSGDETTAYVSLQENNAIMVIDIAGKSITKVRGLGLKDFSKPGNELDLVKDNTILLEQAPFHGIYMPDGIDTYTANGQTYLFTANEGDATEWPGRENATKVGDLTGLDPASAAAQFLHTQGSRYNKVEAVSDMGNDGVYLYGARSFSIWNARDISQVYDSGSDFERITGERLPDYFNSSNSKVEKDDRSTKKGPEPEYVTVGEVGNKAFAFIGLERIGGVMTYDVTNPQHPVFVNYINTRDFSAGINTDSGPEGLEFIPAPESPTGLPLLLVANEVGGTVAILELEVTKVTLDQTSLIFAPGDTGVTLTATVEPVQSNETEVIWSSSDETVAIVNGNGMVTPVSPGQAVITARSKDGYGVAEALVTVGDPSTENAWRLTVMHTNDTHSHLAEVARRATLVKQVRTEGGNSILVDAGDVFSGDLYFTKWQGIADLAFMNYMGYDAMTFGNHEFDKGTGVLAEFVRKARFPIVSSNVDLSKDAHMAPLLKSPANIDVTLPKTEDLSGVYPYVVLEVDGRKVGVFGLTTEDTAETSSPGKDVTFKDAEESARETVETMEQAGLDMIIALSHLGFRKEQELAGSVEGIDLIVGGHTHTKLEEPVIVVDQLHQTPTVVVQANEWGKFLGRVDLAFDEQGNVLTGPGMTTGQLLTVDKNVEEDPAAKDMLAPYNAELEEMKQQVIGGAAVVLDGDRKNVRSKETNLGNLIADGMLARAKELKNADIALMNGGGIRASIDQGDITMGELRTVMPFGNTLFVLDVTGQQLKDGLENGISGAKLADLPGKFPQVAGMKFKWDPKQPDGNKVYDAQIKGENGYEPLDLRKTYRLATNSFVANGGDGYNSFAEAIAGGAYHEDLGYPDYETFMEHVNRLGGTVSPVIEERIVEQAKSSGGNHGSGNPGSGSGNGSGSGSGSSSGSGSGSGTGSGSNSGTGSTSGSISQGNQAGSAPAKLDHELSGSELQLSSTKDAAGQEVQLVSVKPEVLRQALNSAAANGTKQVVLNLPDTKGSIRVSLPAAELVTGSAVSGQVSGRTPAQSPETISLVIHSSLASYKLPLGALKLDAELRQGGAVIVSIAPAEPSLQDAGVRTAAALGATILPDRVLDFRVMLLSGNEEKEMTEFGQHYISRMIPLPQASAAQGNPTAVIIDPVTGEFTFAPSFKTKLPNGVAALEVKRPGNSIYAVIEYRKDFADLNGHWAEQEIEVMASKLLIKGVNDNSFAPSAQISRAEFTALLVRGLGLTAAGDTAGDTALFSDAKPGHSLSREIAAAVKYGLVSKQASDMFGPDEAISRQEMASMIAKAFALVEASGSASGEGAASGAANGNVLTRFNDFADIPAHVREDAALVVSKGIIQGDHQGRFAPADSMTRAQAALVVMRTLESLLLID